MKKFKLIVLFSIIFVAVAIMPSQVFGKNTLYITAEKCTYTSNLYGNKHKREDVKYTGTHCEEARFEASPYTSDGIVFIPPMVYISMEYDEVIVDFSKLDRMEDNFRFKLTPNGSNYIGKYMVEVNRNENRIIFKRIGMTSNAEEYLVSPYKQADEGYFQAGAVYFDGAKDMGYTVPIYKIEAEEKMNSGWIHKFQLGNSHLNLQTVASGLATHPECYVFCAPKQKEKDIYHFSAGQVDHKAETNISVYNDYDGSFSVKNFTITGEQSAETERSAWYTVRLVLSLNQQIKKCLI